MVMQLWYYLLFINLKGLNNLDKFTDFYLLRVKKEHIFSDHPG
jgi:hypothetical protein